MNIKKHYIKVSEKKYMGTITNKNILIKLVENI